MARRTRSCGTHDSELGGMRREKVPSATRVDRGSWSIVHVMLAIPVVLLSVVFILHLQWYSAVKSVGTTPAAAQSDGQSPIAHPRRDVTRFLNPEEHVSRDPRTTQLSWNITKAVIAPDGVRKGVYLINSMTPRPVHHVLPKLNVD